MVVISGGCGGGTYLSLLLQHPFLSPGLSRLSVKQAAESEQRTAEQQSPTHTHAASVEAGKKRGRLRNGARREALFWWWRLVVLVVVVVVTLMVRWWLSSCLLIDEYVLVIYLVPAPSLVSEKLFFRTYLKSVESAQGSARSFFSAIDIFLDDGKGAKVEHYICGTLSTRSFRKHNCSVLAIGNLTLPLLEKSSGEKRTHLPLCQLNGLHSLQYVHPI